MSSDNETSMNCTERYAAHEPNVNPVSIDVRYPAHIFIENFLPGTLLLVRVFMITWLAFGLFGNSLSLVIWASKPQRRKNTSAIYLAALSLTDFLLILCLINYHVVRYWGLYGIDQYPGMCEIYQSLSIFLQYFSTILVFGFTLERYIAVCFPFKRHKLCTAKRAIIAVVILALICLIPTLFQTALWKFNGTECVMKDELISDSTVRGVLTGMEVLFSLTVPLAALVFNLLLLKEMRRLIKSTAVPTPTVVATQNGTSSTNTSHAEAPRSRESSGFVATTVMLVILSFYLIACAVPPGVMYLAQFGWVGHDPCLTDEAMKADPKWQLMFWRMKAKEITDVMCSSHYALNIFIYVFTSKAFRMQAFWMLTCNKEKLLRMNKPAAADKWTFSRRTAPRRMRHVEEQRSLISEPDGRSENKQNCGNGN